MRILNERRSDGRNYLLVDDVMNEALPCVLGRFENLSDAGCALRYLSGLPMSDPERLQAITAIKRADEENRQRKRC